MRYPLLIVGKYLNLNYTHDTPTFQICNDIDEIIMNIGLTHSDETSAKVVIGYKTGIIDPSNVELRDWHRISFVLGYVGFVEDISNMVLIDDERTNKRNFDNWYLTRNSTRQNSIQQRYAEEYSDNFRDPDSIYEEKIISRHYKLIEKVLKLIYEGKIPLRASYREIKNYLAKN